MEWMMIGISTINNKCNKVFKIKQAIYLGKVTCILCIRIIKVRLIKILKEKNIILMLIRLPNIQQIQRERKTRICLNSIISFQKLAAPKIYSSRQCRRFWGESHIILGLNNHYLYTTSLNLQNWTITSLLLILLPTS